MGSLVKNSAPATTPSDVNLNNGLLLYLPFNGNFADSSGNGNTTTAIGGATLAYDEHGDSARAFGGTGNGERLLVTNNGSIKFDTAYSASVDFMIRAYTNYQTILSMVSNVSGLGPSFIIGANTAGMGNFNFGAVDSTSSCDSSGAGHTNDDSHFIYTA